MDIDAFIADFRRFRQRILEDVGEMDDLTVLEFYKAFKTIQRRMSRANPFGSSFNIYDYISQNLSSFMDYTQSNPDDEDNDDSKPAF